MIPVHYDLMLLTTKGIMCTCHIRTDAAGRICNQYGAGSGPVWFSDVDCDGDESHISDCLDPGLRPQYCGHSSDVAIRCG